MTAFNIVRFRVKPGQAEDFIEAHRKLKHPLFKGFGGGWLVKTGDDTFCMVGQWKTFQNIVNARPEMIKMLDQTRAMLEDLGGGLGVTDPVSGSAVVKLAAAKPAKKRSAATRKAKPAKKSPSTERKAKPAKKRAATGAKGAPARKKRAN
jgi:hypothetical protein